MREVGRGVKIREERGKDKKEDMMDTPDKGPSRKVNKEGKEKENKCHKGRKFRNRKEYEKKTRIEDTQNEMRARRTKKEIIGRTEK